MYSIVDTHFHIWDLKLRLEYKKTDGSFDWPGPSLTKIYRKFDAAEAAQEMKSSNVGCAIFVQCLNSCPQEIEWVSQLSQDYPVIKGIVGGLDLTQVTFNLFLVLTHFLRNTYNKRLIQLCCI